MIQKCPKSAKNDVNWIKIVPRPFKNVLKYVIFQTKHISKCIKKWKKSSFVIAEKKIAFKMLQKYSKDGLEYAPKVIVKGPKMSSKRAR